MGIKSVIANAQALSAFDPQKPSILTTDASQYGLGAVLSQNHGGQEKTVGYASRALSDPETRYSTIEREALACWWAMDHFRSYLWGAPFTVRTDHRPLLGLLTTQGSAKATTRIASWYAKMLEYQFHMEYVPGNQNTQADCMSRLPPTARAHTDSQAEEPNEEAQIQLIENLMTPTYTRQEWEAALSRDTTIQRVAQMCITGWPASAHQVPADIRPLWPIRHEFCVHEDMLMRGERLVVPLEMQDRVLQFAHIGHKGMSAVKRSIRESYWWEGMDKDVERHVRECPQCNRADKSKQTSVTPLTPIPAPADPWDTLGLDIIGPISTLESEPVYAITLIDYTTRWPEIHFVHKVDTATVISFLRATFSREGCPRTIITDNGVQFKSSDMQAFLSHLAIEHKFTTPYHPQGNGLVERLNRTIKENLQLAVNSSIDWRVSIHSLLWSLRTTPNKITGHSPFVLMRARKPLGPLTPGWVIQKTRVDIPWEKIEAANKESKAKYKEYYDTKHRTKEKHQWEIGDQAWVKKPWRVQKGQSKYLGPITIRKVGSKYIDTEEGKRWSIDRLARSKQSEPHTEPEQPPLEDNPRETETPTEAPPTGDHIRNQQPPAEQPKNLSNDKEQDNPETSQDHEPKAPEELPTKRPSRLPSWYKDYEMK